MTQKETVSKEAFTEALLDLAKRLKYISLPVGTTNVTATLSLSKTPLDFNKETFQPLYEHETLRDVFYFISQRISKDPSFGWPENNNFDLSKRTDFAAVESGLHNSLIEAEEEKILALRKKVEDAHKRLVLKEAFRNRLAKEHNSYDDQISQVKRLLKELKREEFNSEESLNVSCSLQKITKKLESCEMSFPKVPDYSDILHSLRKKLLAKHRICVEDQTKLEAVKLEYQSEIGKVADIPKDHIQTCGLNNAVLYMQNLYQSLARKRVDLKKMSDESFMDAVAFEEENLLRSIDRFQILIGNILWYANIVRENSKLDLQESTNLNKIKELLAEVKNLPVEEFETFVECWEQLSCCQKINYNSESIPVKDLSLERFSSLKWFQSLQHLLCKRYDLILEAVLESLISSARNAQKKNELLHDISQGYDYIVSLQQDMKNNQSLSHNETLAKLQRDNQNSDDRAASLIAKHQITTKCDMIIERIKKFAREKQELLTLIQ